MSALRLVKPSFGSFQPATGSGTTARLTSDRRYPLWRNRMAGFLAGAGTIVVLVVAYYSIAV